VNIVKDADPHSAELFDHYSIGRSVDGYHAALLTDGLAEVEQDEPE
jgi:hypothetical protein